MAFFSGQRGSVAARIGWLAAEVVVVFLGVYAAFWLEGYRAEQREEERRQQIYEALYADISEGNEEMIEQIPAFDSTLVQPFVAAYEEGGQPIPEPFLFTSGGFDTGMWEAMLQSGGLDALDIGFVQEVDELFGTINYATGVFKQYRQLSDAMILPRLDEGATVFYDSETKQLKDPYQWYPQSLRHMKSLMENVQQESDTLQTKIEARMDEGE